MKRLRATLAGIILTASALSQPELAHVADAGTTAWRDGRFVTDAAGLVHASDVVIQRPNTAPRESMPLGNGTLGAAVWAAGGFTAQLNRSDTLPGRRSPGWLEIPGLAKLTAANDFAARLDLYDGTLVESGGGLTATVYVRADSDELVVAVTGADPATAQTAKIHLWQGRSPQVQAAGSTATLAESWLDDSEPGNSGRRFGSLAALTAGGQDVAASTVDSESAQVSFRPWADGSFSVVVAAPAWSADTARATRELATDAARPHLPEQRNWWHGFWNRVGLIHLASPDGSAQYLESLRTLDLYTAAASSRGSIPGSQAGTADLFSPDQDDHTWDPGAFWHWNLRMQTAANLGAGAYELNEPYFALYRDNLANIEAWTRQHMGGRPGICVPETMRFNGVGIEWHEGYPAPVLNCDDATAPTWNGRTLTTGAEIGLWAWQQYRQTLDTRFLAANYPLMAESARFLLSYATTGPDGFLHTYPSNAHETQWDVHDPTTDLAAMTALFPATIAAAGILHRDADLVAQLRAAIPKIRPFPLDGSVLGTSYDPGADVHNSENIGLEPVWPYGLIGDTGPQSALAKQTFAQRPNVEVNDWSNDPIHAARLGLGADVAKTLVDLTENYQHRPNGLADFVGSDPYGEQEGVVAAALNESLVQDYDGLLRVAPALPPGWDADGTVFVQGGHRVSVQVHSGHISTVAIAAGSTSSIQLRTPWPGQRVEVVDGGDLRTVVVRATTAGLLTIPAQAGRTYLVEQVGAPVRNQPFAPLTEGAATQPKSLGPVTIGISGSSGQLVNTASHSCLDVPGASRDSGTQVEIWTCNGAVNQHWTVAPDGTMQVYSSPPLCLAPLTGDTVGLASCAGQHWVHHPDGTIELAGTRRCLDIGSTVDGTYTELTPCSTAASQRWAFE